MSDSRIPELNIASSERVKKVATLAPGSTVYLCGICGTGMAAVAKLVKDLGYRVLGSDKAFYPPMGELVRGIADRLFEGYDAAHLQEEKIDLVVVGNSVSQGNPEVEYVLAQGINYASMPEVFAALLIGDREACPLSIVVCGTHGKTTTAAAMATLLETAGRAPGFFIGGVPANLPANIRPVDKRIPQAHRAVVLEGDEYDSAFFAKWPKFHSYRPDIMLCTSVEFDHADIYQSLAEIELEFTRLARRVPAAGAIVIAESGGSLAKLIAEWRNDKQVKAEILSYGNSEQAYARLLSRKPVGKDGFAQQLKLRVGTEIFLARTRLTGNHNALNLLAAAAVALRAGLSVAEVINGIETFCGVKRRQEVIFDDKGVLVIEDFAHHPTAVEVTLSGIREAYGGRRIVAVFEPRSNTSRRQVFQEDYIRSFSAADLVYIRELADKHVYSNTGEVQLIDVGVLAQQIAATGRPAFTFSEIDPFVTQLVPQLRSGDVLVLMSNGDFGGLMVNLVDALRKSL